MKPSTPPLHTPSAQPLRTPAQQQALQDQFGLRVAARLSHGAQALPPDVGERLRAARERAVAQRKRPVMKSRRAFTLAGLLGRADSDAPHHWHWAGALALTVVAALGLLQVGGPLPDDPYAVAKLPAHLTEAARLDAALLTDDLPLQAYTDPGFAQFLQTSASVTDSH